MEIQPLKEKIFGTYVKQIWVCQKERQTNKRFADHCLRGPWYHKSDKKGLKRSG